MRARRYVLAAITVLSALVIAAGSLLMTKKTMYATAYTSVHPIEALGDDDALSLCPGQTTANLDATDIGTPSSLISGLTVGRAALALTFPATANCFNLGSDCSPPSGSAPMTCGGRNLADPIRLAGTQYGSRMTMLYADGKRRNQAHYFGSTVGSVPASGLRATLTSAPNAFAGECYTIKQAGERRFAKESDVTAANCHEGDDPECVKYCVYLLDFL